MDTERRPLTSPTEAPDVPPRATRTPAVRIAAGLGDPQRERELLAELTAGGDVLVVERCLTGDQLAESVRRHALHAALLAGELHRLREDTFEELSGAKVATVLLASDEDAARWRDHATRVLPLTASTAEIRLALREAVAAPPQLRPPLPRPPVQPAPRPSVNASAAAARARNDTTAASSTRHAPAVPQTTQVLVLASGHGAPGRTTIAVALATACGAVAPTLLLEADLTGSSVAAYVNADPSRNMAMLAHAEPATAGDWSRAIEQEVQPLGRPSARGFVLCGVPKVELSGTISVPFFTRLLAESRRRYRYVIVDAGAELFGADAAVHRAAVQAADQVLLVTAADAVGLWHAREAVRLLRARILPNSPAAGPRRDGHERGDAHEGSYGDMALPNDRLVLVLNQFDRRHHHHRREAERQLAAPIAAVVPYDHGAAQRAIEWQRSLVLDRRSRAGRALLDLAERLHAGRIVLPPDPEAAAWSAWTSWLGRWRTVPPSPRRWLRGVSLRYGTAGSRTNGTAPPASTSPQVHVPKVVALAAASATSAPQKEQVAS